MSKGKRKTKVEEPVRRREHKRRVYKPLVFSRGTDIVTKTVKRARQTVLVERHPNLKFEDLDDPIYMRAMRSELARFKGGLDDPIVREELERQIAN